MRKLINSRGNRPGQRLVAEGRRIYEETLSLQLEPENVGRFVAIEPSSGRYFLGDTGAQALVAARSEMPDRIFYLMRIGYRAAHTIGGHVARVR